MRWPWWWHPAFWWPWSRPKAWQLYVPPPQLHLVPPPAQTAEDEFLAFVQDRLDQVAEALRAGDHQRVGQLLRHLAAEGDPMVVELMTLVLVARLRADGRL